MRRNSLNSFISVRTGHLNVNMGLLDRFSSVLGRDYNVDYSWSEGLDRTRDSQIENDGFDVFVKQSPMKLKAKNFVRRALGRMPQRGTLILIRHGETKWNYNSTFTGWVDVDLSERGTKEMEHASRLLLERGYRVDVAFTSRLKRAIRSTWIILRELNQVYRPVFKSWRMNERMYGALEGSSKLEAAEQHGEKQVQLWRRDLDERPPMMNSGHPFWHGEETKYKDLENLPVTESLSDTMNRALPLWYKRILPALESGQNVLVVAHANSLRGLVKHIDKLSAEQIRSVGIPNGIPLVYKFDQATMEPLVQENAVAPLKGEFLEQKGLLRQALQREEELAANVPGYTSPLSSKGSAKVGNRLEEGMTDPLLRGLLTLDSERKLIDRAMESLKVNTGGGLDLDGVELGSMAWEVADAENLGSAEVPGVKHLPSMSTTEGPQLVIIRHGKTEHNKLGLFTGWADAHLAPEGRAEAQQAGKLLFRHGITFDVVYTSWLSRAIETAWLVVDQHDSLWLPIIKTWRLNERMYGALTGLSKVMVKERHGSEKFKAWRRGYKARPPPLSSYSSDYPGNDDRYRNYVKDVRYSFTETLLRTFSEGQLQLHRKFPKSESLKDCMDRTIPYVKNVILPDYSENNKTVLVASSENAIRGMLMYLLKIPVDRIAEVEIPTGLPLILDPVNKRIRLLDDGSDDDILERYNFGSSPELLFEPCDVVDGVLPEPTECFVIGGRTYTYDPLIRLSDSKSVMMPFEEVKKKVKDMNTNSKSNSSHQW